MEKGINEAGKAGGVSSLAKAMSLAAAIVMAAPAMDKAPVVGDVFGVSEAYAGSACAQMRGKKRARCLAVKRQELARMSQVQGRPRRELKFCVIWSGQKSS